MIEWSIEKINDAVSDVRENGIVYFDTYINTQAELENLDEQLFKKRNDLILHYEIKNKNNTTSLSPLENIKKIKTNNYDPSIGLENINNLKYLEINNQNKKTVDILFLEGLDNLQELYLSGKFSNIEIIGRCRKIEKLYLMTTIVNYEFMQFLNRIKKIWIDSCQAPDDFVLLNKPSLEELSILSIKNLGNIDAIKYFSTLKKLKLSASKIKKLPDLSKLVNLHELELKTMKSWENPEIIKTIPFLKKLRLEEINTKINAEQFYFLTEIKTLTEVNFKFIDFNKKRIDKLTEWFIENNKENIIKK